MKNNSIKALVCTILLFIMIVMPATAQAAEISSNLYEERSVAAEVRINDTEWHYRVNENGEVEKRLWSRTYAMWMTGWIKA